MTALQQYVDLMIGDERREEKLAEFRQSLQQEQLQNQPPAYDENETELLSNLRKNRTKLAPAK